MTERQQAIQEQLGVLADAINAAPPYSQTRRRLHAQRDALIQEDIALECERVTALHAWTHGEAVRQTRVDDLPLFARGD